MTPPAGPAVATVSATSAFCSSYTPSLAVLVLEQGEIDIDPGYDKLAAQLGSIKWGIDSRGRIKIK